MELYKIYRPLIATPYKRCEDYMEFEPCDALKPYIRCFWGTRRAIKQEKGDAVVKGIVIPDTCMDIIFTTDFTNNKIESGFCGMDDRVSFTNSASTEDKIFFMFGIRFYAWGAVAFAEESMRDTRGIYFDAGCHFSKIKKEIEKQLFDVTDIYQLIPIVEKVLLKCFSDRYKNNTVLQAVSKIVLNKGNLSMADLQREVFISNRQLERLFDEYVGISPKSLASTVRFQYLWSDLLLNKDFNTLDAVYKYGYSDQAHLCHDFKKYYSMNMADARKHAMQNVGNIQDTYSQL